MRRRHSRGKWPICTVTALTILLALCFAIPRSWIEAFFSPLAMRPGQVGKGHFVLQVIPEPLIVPDTAALAPVDASVFPQTMPGTPRWWSLAWQEHLQARAAEAMAPAPAESQDMFAHEILETAIAEASWLSKPDSSLAARLARLQLINQAEFRRMVPLLNCLINEQRYREIQARKAELFGEFLLER